MLVKNAEIEIEITALGNDGEGIGHTGDGMAVFVAGALPGDIVVAHIVKVKKNYAYAITNRIVKPSPYRVDKMCPVADKCGGCTLQHLSYDYQLKVKEQKVMDCLTRIGGFNDVPMEPIIGSDHIYYYRNKAQFPVGKDAAGKTAIGFYRQRSHAIVENKSCAIQDSVNEPILNVIEKYMETYHVDAYDEVTHQGLLRHVFTRVGYFTREVIVVLVINGNSIPHEDYLVDALIMAVKKEGMTLKGLCLNINKADTNVIMSDKLITIYGEPYITDTIGDVKYRISPLSFYQVNPLQTVKLYDTVKEFADLKGTETVWDLYCGIGTITLYLAGQAKKVCGVEVVPEAINDARENARLNGIANAGFYVGAAEEVLPAYYEGKGENHDKDFMKPDVIVVDPPRKGCDEACLSTMIKMDPEKIVYVSCDPATLARDLKYLCENGYALKRVRPVDQFCHTMHVETVALLTRR